ncbi:tigger transposable element-derived protein 2 [Cephus cinctus]|uniref:Tigger transposable element-derived protein 2 n=1 Tax=Cephus cinctus TaxID=211228 RepID=A0AAJ7BUX7_CEPCN|nr:tigger transposable element-derived protein 2 [Cephus cinctus]
MSSDVNKKRKKNISHPLSVKQNAIKELNNGVPVSVIANNLNVTNATVMLWKKNENKLNEWLEECNSETSGGNKRMRKDENNIIDRIMWMWFREKRACGLPLHAALIQVQANYFHEALELQDKFEASNEWLCRWQKRHDIQSVTVCGEKLSANTDAVQSLKIDLNNYIEAKGLTLDQVFYCDITRLNFKMLPRTILSAKYEEEVLGFKGNKERITIMACSNASGSLKLPLAVIGKFERPRAIKDLKVLPVYYKNQKNAWMTAQIFSEWFENEFVPAVIKFLQIKGLQLKAVLYFDNCSAHPTTLSKGNVITRFLPLNTTSLTQPMDQNCLQTLKSYYRQYLMVYLLQYINSGGSEDTLSGGLKKITIRNVIFWIASAWQRVSVETIKKSWNKLLSNIDNTGANNDNCTITHTTMDDESILETSQTTERDQKNQLMALSQKFQEALKVLDIDVELSHVDLWLNCTTKMSPEECYDDNEILQIFRGELNLNKKNFENNNSKNVNKEISVAQGYNAIKTAVEYCQNNNKYSSEIIMALHRAQEIVTNEFLLNSKN